MDPWCVRRAGPGLWLVSCPGEVEPALPLCLVSTPVSLSSVPGWTRRSLPTEPQMSSINWSINDRVSDTTVSSCPLVLLLLVQLYFKIHNLTFIHILFIYYYFCNSDLDVFWHLCSSIPPHPHPPARVFSLHTHTWMCQTNWGSQLCLCSSFRLLVIVSGMKFFWHRKPLTEHTVRLVGLGSGGPLCDSSI